MNSRKGNQEDKEVVERWPPQGTSRQQLAARFPGEGSQGPVTQKVHSNRESEMVIGAH